MEGTHSLVCTRNSLESSSPEDWNKQEHTVYLTKDILPDANQIRSGQTRNYIYSVGIARSMLKNIMQMVFHNAQWFSHKQQFY